eukprot:scaffold2376_cov115-Isochrysis_galbana.AAC.12
MYDHKGWWTLTTGNNTLPTTTHPLLDPKGNVLPTSWAPPPPSPAGPPRIGSTPDAPVNLNNSTLTYDHIGWWTLTTGNDTTPLPTTTYPLLNPKGDMLPTNWAPPPPLHQPVPPKVDSPL